MPATQSYQALNNSDTVETNILSVNSVPGKSSLTTWKSPLKEKIIPKCTSLITLNGLAILNIFGAFKETVTTDNYKEVLKQAIVPIIVVVFCVSVLLTLFCVNLDEESLILITIGSFLVDKE
jgi:hypothetical protein